MIVLIKWFLEPYVKIFEGEKGYKLLDAYSNPNSKVFPPMNFLEFVWSKDTYLTKFHKKILFHQQLLLKNTMFKK